MPFPFRTRIVTSAGGGPTGFSFLAFFLVATWVAFDSGLGVRLHEVVYGGLNRLVGRLELERPRDVAESLEPRLLEAPRREVVGELRVPEQRLLVERPAAADSDLDVLGDRRDDGRDLGDVGEARDLLLHRLHELLLASVSVQVRVGVPVAHEVERRRPVELLVARVQVDLRVPLQPVEARVVVEVALVDVDIDPAELIHDLLEAPEVDGDQVVDLDSRQRLHRLEAAALATRAEGLVDARAVGRLAPAVDLDVEIAREGQHRDRLSLRIEPDQHDRVRAGLHTFPFAVALVIADHHGHGRLAGERHVEDLLGLDRLGCVCADSGDAFVDPEPEAAHERTRQHQEDDDQPEEGLADPARPAAPGRAAISCDRRQRAERRNGRMAVRAVRAPSACASLQRRLHTKSRRKATRRGYRRRRPEIAVRRPVMRRVARRPDSGRASAPPLRPRRPSGRHSRLDLIGCDAPEREIAGGRVREVNAADAGGREHRVRLSELDPDCACSEQVEELRLLGVVRARGIAESRANAPEALRDQILLRQRLARLVPLAAGVLVQVFRERLGQPVRERLHDDRAVVVLLTLEPRRQLVRADPGRDGEGADVVREACVRRRNKISQ